MTEQDNTAPAVWDPTARGGAGGWVRRKPPTGPQPPAPQSPPPQPPVPQPPFRPAGSEAPTGGVGDEGPFLGARPYLPPAPPTVPSGYGYPQAPQTPQAPPTASPGARPAAPGGFPSHTTGFPPGAPQGQPPYGAFPPPPGLPPAPPYGHYDAQYGHGSGPGQYEEIPPYEDEPLRSRKPLYIALGVLVALVLGVGTVWAVQNSGGGSADQTKAAPSDATPRPAPSQADSSTPGTAAATTPTPSASASASASTAGPNAAAQAKALDDLLSRGENAKAPIGNAVAKVNSCPGTAEVDSAAQVLQDGAAQRDQLISDLAKLSLGDLPGGTDAAQLLRTAWQQSGDIDRAYAAWARTVSSQGCTNGAAPGTADLKRANELNPQATQSKKDFVAKWNSLAGTFNLTARTWDRI